MVYVRSPRRRWGLVTAALAGVVFSACGTSTAPTPGASPHGAAKTQPLPELTVTYSSQTGNRAPLWIGVDKGFFVKNGVKVTLRYVSGSATSLAALIGGHTDIFEGSCGHTLAAIAKGSPLRIIGFAEYTIPYQLYVDPNIRQPEQLIGKNVAVIEKGDSSYLFVERMLKAMHLLGKVHLVPTGSQSGEFAAFVAHEVVGLPNTPATMTKLKDGTYRALGDPAKYGITGDANAMVVSAAYLKTHRQVLVDFLKGYTEALAYAYAHPRYVERLYAQVLHTSSRFNQATYQEFFQTSPADGGLPPNPTPTVALVRQQMAVEQAAQPSFHSTAIHAQKIIDASLMQAVSASPLWKQIWPHGLPRFDAPRRG
jgi:ABC-type nitrate/sulfonate/bicarbonate transport system substrate-binding protein